VLFQQKGIQAVEYVIHPAQAALLASLLMSSAAYADVSLTNRDSQAHDITVKCGSTTQTSIGSNTTRGLGRGPCTVTVKSTKASATGNGNDKLIIKNGTVGIQ
jgi:hypothetical protein